MEVWNAIIERADAQGEGSLSLKERRIYLVNLFLIELESGGLSGFLYNVSPEADERNWERLRDTAEAVRSFGNQHVAEQLVRFANLLEKLPERSAGSTWRDYLLARELTDAILEEAEDDLRKHSGILWDDLEAAALTLRPSPSAI